MYDSDKRKILSILAHASIFISATLVSIGIPIAVMLVSDDPVVKDNAKEAVNFHLNVWLWGFIIGILCFVLIGWLILPIFLLVHWGLTIAAILHCLGNSDRPYRYPFIFRLL